MGKKEVTDPQHHVQMRDTSVMSVWEKKCQ